MIIICVKGGRECVIEGDSEGGEERRGDGLEHGPHVDAVLRPEEARRAVRRGLDQLLRFTHLYYIKIKLIFIIKEEIETKVKKKEDRMGKRYEEVGLSLEGLLALLLVEHVLRAGLRSHR